MKLHDLKKAIDQAVKNAGDCTPDVEVWYGDNQYTITHIGQFGVMPDVTLTIEPVTTPILQVVDPSQVKEPYRKHMRKVAKKLRKRG